MNIVLVILALISFFVLLWQVSNLVSAFFGSPYVKTSRRIIIEALKLARLKKREIFYDLGCGDGQSLIEAAKLGAQTTGFEISPYYYLYAKLRTLRYPNIRVRYQNINHVNLKKADVVYCYLLPEFLKKLSIKFQKELKPDSRIISIGFPLKIKKGQKHKISNISNHKIYIYTF